MKVVCVGGGPAGFCLAILLRLHAPQHDVTILERDQADAASGWGVTFGTFALSKLADRDPVSAARIRDAAITWSDQVMHLRGEKVISRGDRLGCNITRRWLLNILADRARELGVSIRYGIEVQSGSDLPEADLIVAADGVNSRVRQANGGFETHEVTARNKYIWLGTSQVYGDFNYFFVHTDSGWVWAYGYGIDARTSTFIVECSSQTWAGLGFDAMSTEDALRVLEKIFADHLAGHPLIGGSSGESNARWLNFRTITNEHWYAGNVVLAGDSAHTSHFSTGMGTTLAIEDAIALADSLQEHPDTEQALEAYQNRRKAELVPFLSAAHCSTKWLENISRYIDRKPQQFGALLNARQSPLVAVLPPAVSYGLCRAVQRFTLLDHISHRIARVAKVIYGRGRLLR